MQMLGLEQAEETTFLDFGYWQALLATELKIIEQHYFSRHSDMDFQANSNWDLAKVEDDEFIRKMLGRTKELRNIQRKRTVDSVSENLSSNRLGMRIIDVGHL